MRAPARRHAVIAGGGTAGHVLPAVAVAQALLDRGHAPETIELVGSRRGQEAVLFAGQPFPSTLWPGRGLSRQGGARAVWANVGAIAGTARAVVRAMAALARWRPEVVVSVGGYASFPAGVAALVLGIPVVVVNVDAVPGLVHRWLGRYATACAVAFPGTPLPKAVVTGSPVRSELAAVDRSPPAAAEARSALGLPAGRQTIATFGGSLGSRRVNEAVAALAARWSDRGDVTVLQVTGRRDYPAMRELVDRAAVTGGSPRSSGGLCHRVVPFEDRMDLLYAAADLVVCRAGAMTVAELAATGVPSVLVPLPGAPGDHQTANARALVDAGAAVLLPDAACDVDGLEGVVGALLADPSRRSAMAGAARDLAAPGAAARVAALVDTRAKRRGASGHPVAAGAGVGASKGSDAA